MEQFAGVRFVLLYTLVLNLVVTATKITVGYLTGSLSILADGFDSFFNSVTNVIGLVAIYLSRRPPDEDHPYGHRRYEILMTLIVAALLFATCIQLLRSAYDRFVNPSVPEITVWSFASLIFSIAAHLYTARYEERRGRELRSEFLIADASHTRADVLVSVGVLVGLIVVSLGYPIVDPIIAVILAFFIAKIGVDIIRSSSRILVDVAVLEIPEVVAIAQEVPGVLSIHHVRSRGQEDDIHLDLHVRVAPDTPMAEAHAIAHQVQRRLKEKIAGLRDVIIHIEPQPHQETSHPDLVQEFRRVAHEVGVTIHNVNIHELNRQYYSDLHIEVPQDMSLGEAHIQANRLEDSLKSAIPQLAEVTTHIEPTSASEIKHSDETPQDSQIARRVQELAAGLPEVNDCHDVQVLATGEELLVSMHCTMDEELPITRAHDIATFIEDDLRREFAAIARVSIHVEPGTVNSESL